MEYRTTIQIEMPTFVSCRNCELWFPVESEHSCPRTIDEIAYNHNITWGAT